MSSITETARHDPRVLISALWLTPSAGGMVNTIGKFRQALDADAVSFTQPDVLAAEGTGVIGAYHVLAADNLLGKHFTYAPPVARRVAEMLADQADLFSCHSIWRYQVNWTLAQVEKRPRPYWFVPHGVLDPWVFTYNRIYKRLWMWLLGRRFLANASRVIFATNREMEKARHAYSGKRGVVIHWPVTPVQITEREEVRRATRARLGIPADARVLLFLGRFHPLKRPLETIAAVARQRDPNLHLIMAGPEHGITAADCKRLAACERFTNIHLVGQTLGADKLGCFAAADGLILLSHRENFGHSVAEALSAKIPVIASTGVDLIECLKPLKCGWFVDAGNSTEVDSALAQFRKLSESELRSMGQSGATWVIRELSMEKFTRRIRALAVETVNEFNSRHQ